MEGFGVAVEVVGVVVGVVIGIGVIIGVGVEVVVRVCWISVAIDDGVGFPSPSCLAPVEGRTTRLGSSMVGYEVTS